MAISDFFLNPLGLAGLASLIPLIILYIIKPDPRRLRIPTMEFLSEQTDEGGTNPVIERLRRNLMLLLQILALILISLSLASPYVETTATAETGNTVIVIDASASMATQTGDGTRFENAVADAKSEVTSTTSVIVSGGSSGSVLTEGSAEEARSALESLSVSDTQGSLADAVSRAASVASDDSRVLVYSDFAGATEWEVEVEKARASDVPVALNQYNRGGDSNVGITDMAYDRNTVSVTVTNFGESEQQRSVSLGGSSESVTLGPGSSETVQLDVPPGRSRVSLSPGDSFPTDDTAYISGPSKSEIDVLLVTNDENTYLSTALSVMEEVSLTVKNPPASVPGSYDIVIYSNVNPDRLLQGTVQKGRDTIENGGGVVIQAQEGLSRAGYGDLLPVSVDGVQSGGSARVVSDDPLVEGIEFSSPDRYLSASLDEGTAIVNTSDGSPLIAVSGRSLYYGFMEDSSEFKFNYLYPVFWKRVVYRLSGRDRLSSMNVETGDSLTFSDTQTVSTPSGSTTTGTLVFDEVGFYSVGENDIAANLLDSTESDVKAAPIEESSVAARETGTTSEEVPINLTPLVALAALLIVLSEVGYMKYRGDI
ncbi:BatA domain-containing protein [Halorutilales archaeon Cl-col2-1]